MDFSKAITQVKGGTSLTEAQAQECAAQIIKGTLSDSDIAGLLLALAEKGESVAEIVGFARAMRADMQRVPIKGELMDVCGTGGTGHVRFNVSTASAFVLAALDIPVAKHGNRGSGSTNGSFDFLEALGIDFDLTPVQSAQLLAEQNLCFLFARNYHVGVKHAANARKKLGRRTIFNLVGPLCNPAGATHQVIGTPSLKAAEPLAVAIQQLGCIRSFVVVGAGGSDEVTVHDASSLLVVTSAGVELTGIDPLSVGIDIDEMPKVGGAAIENAAMFEQFLLEPSIEAPLGALIALNAATSVWCFGAEKNLESAFIQVKKAILSGKLAEKVQDYKSAIKKLKA